MGYLMRGMVKWDWSLPLLATPGKIWAGIIPVQTRHGEPMLAYTVIANPQGEAIHDTGLAGQRWIATSLRDSQ
ncbi:hypothetical protein [Pseudomonas sp. MYb185]|uniref:hypothetical protein n=1 Tax=Pseudomonas sp. MYb185 TaxID=1848729 RepID=UPI000CFB4476|nr:hypothetical protein [Pseudomonas sp. MYb185]PRB84657.1 hypothetical protein CQ007_02490 [Pseudomonas sp. MYb185]